MLDVISRDEAHARGLKRFYTGKPCHKHHDSERYVSTGGCIACLHYAAAPKVRQHRNLAWPERGFLFITPCTRPEQLAAIRYVQHMRWHETALLELRKDPALMAQFSAEVTDSELAKARAVLHQYELAQTRDKAVR